LVAEVKPKIMNTIDVTDEQMSRVQNGLNLVVNGDYGYAPGIFSGTPYHAAGKTGTAQASYWGENEDHRGESVTNITFIGYAPYDDPEIAVAVVIPYLPNENTGTANLEMSKQIMDAYFEVGEYEDEEPTTVEEAEEEGETENEE